MSGTARLYRTPQRMRQATLFEARVIAQESDGGWRLSSGAVVRTAVSCLLCPLPGDRVLAGGSGEGAPFILHILERDAGQEARLHVAGASALGVAQQRIELAATEQVAIRSLKDVEVTAATGTLALNARNLFKTVGECLIESAEHYVATMGDYALRVRDLLHLRGRHGVVTAEQEFKLDAERIHIG